MNRFTTILLLSAILIRFGMALFTPLGPVVKNRLEGLNDELGHFAYVNFLNTHHRFPVQTVSCREPDRETWAECEFYHPPLYYIIAAAACSITAHADDLLVSRVVSILFGIATFF
jgi:hypothetical protein